MPNSRYAPFDKAEWRCPCGANVAQLITDTAYEAIYAAAIKTPYTIPLADQLEIDCPLCHRHLTFKLFWSKPQLHRAQLIAID